MDNHFEDIIKSATERFREYTSHYDLNQPKIALKAHHTYRVASFCKQIAEAEGLCDEDVFIAFMCGLLHDIGRFEQVRRYNTFNDSESVNHAHLSCEILWGIHDNSSFKSIDWASGEGIIRDFIPEDDYDELIYTAIYWHSAFRLPDNLDQRHSMFCNIIRDADKVDIFRVNVETPLPEIHNVPEEEFKTSDITPEVLETFFEHRCVLREVRRTAIDFLISYLCLYWELVYDKSKNMALEQGYLRRLANYPSTNSKTIIELEAIRKELGL